MKRIAAFCMRLWQPPPRRVPLRPGWWLALTIVVVIAAGLIAAVSTERLSFAQPWWFSAVLPATWWCWRTAAAGWHGMSPLRIASALLIRMLLITTALAALAEPRLVHARDDLALVYCVDLSDSVTPPAVDAVRRWMLATVGAKPQRDTAGLVAFAHDAAVELPPRQAFPFETFATRIERGGTDIERALLTAADAIPEDRPGRVVLISDGAANAGDALRAAGALAARKIPVDVLPIDYRHDAEVWLERMELPRDVRPHETYDASVLLGAVSSGRGVLILNENGHDIARQSIVWEAGKSRYRLPLTLRGPGSYDYIARVEPDPGCDGWRENNLALGRIDLAGGSRVLLLVDPDGNPADWQFFSAALSAGSRTVDRKSAWECPGDALALEPYDACVLLNVPADQLDAAQQRALRDAVHDLGIGLVMIGGRSSFGPGGWNRTPVEEALPVTMDVSGHKVLPKGALAIILHTCEFAEGNTWAKRITKQAMRVLSADDEVAVAAYGMGGMQWIFPLSRAGDYDRLAPLVEAAQPGDMPAFGPGLEMVHSALKGSDASVRHCIIISDGDPSPPDPKLVQQLIDEKITVSTVAVFPHGGDPSLFAAIASLTGGRSYHPTDAELLPSIFVKEAKVLRRSQLQNRRFTPRHLWPSPALKGIGQPPDLGGMVLSTAKPSAQVALLGPQDDEESPVLASWRYGIGASVAFTSDLGSNWGADWTTWPHYAAFCEQMMLTVGRNRNRGALRVAAEPGSEAVDITVEDLHPEQGGLVLAARLIDRDGGERTVDLREVTPGRWRGRAALTGSGRYRVAVAGAGGQRSEQAVAGFAVAYSPEYRRFRADTALLRRIATATGGRELHNDAEPGSLWAVPHERRITGVPVIAYAIALIACLLPLDLAVRRLRFDPRAWFKRTATATDPGLDRLLQVKRRAVAVQPPAPMVPPIGPAAPPAPRAPRPSAPSAPTSPAGSTAGRLLDAKRRRQLDNQPPDQQGKT